MEPSNWINLGILIVTAAVGIVTWRSAQKSARDATVAASRSAGAAEEAVRLQAKMLEIEKQRHVEAGLDTRRANLHAEHTRGHYEAHLIIVNTGPATATNIEIYLDEKPIELYREFARRSPQKRTLGPNGRLQLPYILGRGTTLSQPFQVLLVWDDDSGMEGEWSGTV